jgi:hypothetical protein
MVAHRWGCQTPNGEPFNSGDMLNCFDDGFYLIMQGEFNRLPELRDGAPQALIMGRFYLPNWYTTDPVLWALDVANILNQVNESDPAKRRNRDLIDCYTWANEQNLKVESGGVIGSSPGDMIKPGHYEIIRDWNLRFLDQISQTSAASVPRVFPALAMGNSDDQDDGGSVGLDILQPVIDRCDYGAIHPYWMVDKPLDDEWVGLGRIEKQLPFFSQVPVLVTETGNFAVTNPLSPSQYVAAGYTFQDYAQIFGFAYFIWSDPTKSHQLNDMSRNPAIAEALRKVIRTVRPTEWHPVTPVPPDVPPGPTEPPETSTGGLSIGYQAWQWNAIPLVGNYDQLKKDMEEIGATILSDKYADSDVFMGQFDLGPSGRPDPMAVTGIQVMKDRKSWCADNGYIYMPWDVPRAIPVNGDPFEGAKQEALFHADVCNQVGLDFRMSDLEFYPSFFGWSIPRAGVPSVSFFRNDAERNDAAELYYRTFAENSDTRTVLQPDPRQWGTILFQKLTPYLHSIIWQSYAYYFQTVGDSRSHSEIIQDSINKSKWLELEYFGLSLYSDLYAEGDTPPNLAQELLDMALAVGAQTVMVYKAPVNENKWEILKNMASNTPVIPENIEEIRNDAWAAAEAVRRFGPMFADLADRARKAGYGWMGNGLDSARLSVEAAELAAKTATKAPKD